MCCACCCAALHRAGKPGILPEDTIPNHRQKKIEMKRAAAAFFDVDKTITDTNASSSLLNFQNAGNSAGNSVHLAGFRGLHCAA